MGAPAAPNMRYSCTALEGTNKNGELKCDSNGYYEVVLSALDYPNFWGAIYRTDSARRLLDKSSMFMRRVIDGNLYGENGHPRRETGMNNDEYSLRMYDVNEQRVSHHISDVWIDDSGKIKDQDGKPFTAIVGLVKPDGEMGHLLKNSFDNPKQNTCFSVRSVTDNYLVGSKVEKDFVEIITWDWVTSPGLRPSTKFTSPGLESIFGLNEMLDMPVSIIALERAVKAVKSGRLSMESDSVSSMMNVIRVANQRANINQTAGDKKWLNW